MVNDTGRQGSLRSDDHQVDIILPDGSGQCIEISGGDIEVLGDSSGTGVARRGEKLAGLWTLRQLPDDGVLPGAITDNEYFQGLPPGGFSPAILTPSVPLSLKEGSAEIMLI